MSKKTPSKGWIIKRTHLSRGSLAKDRYAAAVHEAGHAVVAHSFGEQVKRLSLVDEKGSASDGFTEVDHVVRNGIIDPVAGVIVALAGHEAEHRICRRPSQFISLGDFQDAIDLGCSKKTIGLVAWVARRFVTEFEPHIRRVAKALFKRGSLTRRQFLSAMRGRPA